MISIYIFSMTYDFTYLLSGERDEQAENTEDLGPLKLFCVTVIAGTCHLTIQTHTVYT